MMEWKIQDKKIVTYAKIFKVRQDSSYIFPHTKWSIDNSSRWLIQVESRITRVGPPQRNSKVSIICLKQWTYVVATFRFSLTNQMILNNAKFQFCLVKGTQTVIPHWIFTELLEISYHYKEEFQYIAW